MDRTTHFPCDLARHVAEQLAAKRGRTPPLEVMVDFIETVYFASLKTEEGRPPLCTINFFYGETPPRPATAAADHWQLFPIEPAQPLDVRSLTKLARAVDPAVSSLAVACSDAGELTLAGLVDQELRYSDFVALDAAIAPERPGLFQVSVTGVGNISVYMNYLLVGSLEQDTFVGEYHDVLWNGPVYDRLLQHYQSYLASPQATPIVSVVPDCDLTSSGLMIRWINSICRILMNVQRYKHGGGLIISPTGSFEGLNVKYKIEYDRLPRALLDLHLDEFLRSRLGQAVKELSEGPADRPIPSDLHYRLKEYRKRFDEHKGEVLGCARFIASMSCVDGFIVLDRHLTARGFGVEVRSGESVDQVMVAGDSLATPALFRTGDMHQYGTRHRAMMRYCYENPGSLGFVVSQDGDIRAMTRIGDNLIFWENIEVQLAFRSESGCIIRQEHSAARSAA